MLSAFLILFPVLKELFKKFDLRAGSKVMGFRNSLQVTGDKPLSKSACVYINSVMASLCATLTSKTRWVSNDLTILCYPLCSYGWGLPAEQTPCYFGGEAKCLVSVSPQNYWNKPITSSYKNQGSPCLLHYKACPHLSLLVHSGLAPCGAASPPPDWHCCQFA